MITQARLQRLDINQGSLSLLDKWSSQSFDTLSSRALLAGLLALLWLIPLLAGPVVQYVYAHDAFIFLDGGWRVLHGQRPQVDFSTNLGPLIFLFTAAGLAIAKHAGYALVVTQALIAAIIAVLAYVVTVRRLPRLAGFMIAGAIVLLALAPYNPGEAEFELTFGMMYNRFGFALIGVLLIEATQGGRRGFNQKRDELLGGAITGFICAFLLFLKITYFLSAVALVIALLPYRRQIRERFVGMIFAALAFSFAILAYLRFNIPALVREFRLSAGGKHMPRLGPLQVGIASFELVILLLVVGFLFSWIFATLNNTRLPLSRPWAILATIFFGFALLITNHQAAGLPLNAVICVLIASEVAISWLGWKSHLSLALPALLVVIGLCAPWIELVAPTLIAYALPTISRINYRGDYAKEMRLNAPAVSDFRSRDITPRFDQADNALPGNYAIFVNQGLALLRDHSSQNEKVVSLEFSNPFSIALERTPPKDGTTCLQYGVTFDDSHKLSPDRLFGDAELVMLPKVFSAPLLSAAIVRNYLKPLHERFGKVAESSQWTLYRRLSK